MKKFVWVYLLISLLSAISTIVASIPLETHSFIPSLLWFFSKIGNIVLSPLVFISSIVIILLGFLNRLQLRRVFVTLSLCYLTFWAFGQILLTYQGFYSRFGFRFFAILWLPTLQDLRVTSSWSEYVYWLWSIAWLALSIHGIRSYRKLLMAAGDKVSEAMAEILRPGLQVSIILASLLLGILAGYLTVLLVPILGIRPLNVLIMFPYMVAFYVFINFLSIKLRRGEKNAGQAAAPRSHGQAQGQAVAPQISWFAPASLILVGLDFFKILVQQRPLFSIDIYSFPWFSLAGIICALAALYKYRKSPGVRGAAMAAVSLICGGLFLLISLSQYYLFTSAMQKVERGFDHTSEASKEAEVLVDACRRGDRASVETLLANGADINAPTKYGETALMAASKRGRREIIEMLIVRGAEIDTEDNSGNTALIEASSLGRTEIVEILLARGANVNKIDRIGRTPLIVASFRGHEKIVLLLLAKGAEINAREKRGQTALGWACFMGHREVVRALLDKGADVNAKALLGGTALSTAAYKGDLEIVQLMLAKGADVNAQSDEGETALSSAAGKGNLEIVKLLLAKGADVNVKNKNGGTALIAASREGHPEVVEVLLAHGADDYSKHRALQIPSKKNGRKVRELLVKAGAK